MQQHHPVTWQAPQPLWSRFGPSAATAASAPKQARPALLRFASDDFMDRLLALLARDPAQLGSLVARPETWRQPLADAPDLVDRTPLPARVSSGRQQLLRQPAALQARPRIAPVATTVDQPLKLYQPAHQRHYLVAASLVCAQPGLPDRRPASGGAEPLHAVLRRLLPATHPGDPTLHEFAYLKDAAGARWQRVGDEAASARAVAGEETLPLFPLAYRDETDRARTLWAGSVPVGRREDYMATTIDRSAVPSYAAGQLLAVDTPVAAAPTTFKLARVTQFQMEVAEPWKTQIRSAYQAALQVQEDSEADGQPDMTLPKARRAFDFNLQQQQVSWLILLDLADWIEAYLPDLWTVIANQGVGANSLPTLRRDLHTCLAGAQMPAELVSALRAPGSAADIRPPAASLRDALRAVRAAGVRTALEAAQQNLDSRTLGSADWPPFHFVLAGLGLDAGLVPPAYAAIGPFEQLATLPAPPTPPDAEYGPTPDPLPGPPPPQPPPPSDTQLMLDAARAATDLVDRLTALMGQALDATGDAAAPPLPFALQVKNALGAAANDAGWFVIRFVQQRRDCGPLHAPAVSAPTQRFQLASFFDADAPARAVRITLPTDTSPAGLRKFHKNTAFVVSDMLCGQIQRAKGLGLVDLVRSVLPWPLHKDLDVGAGSCQTAGGINIGMICSLSIPIITICALILLIIIVSLLDFIFRWLPYFVICFPVPGLKGKK